MANRRMINSDLFSDDVFMELNDITRLTWIGLIVMSADDQGRLQDNELLIKSQIFPMDNKTPVKIKNSLDILEHHGMIHRYQKDGKKLIQIVNWWKHQSPSWASDSNYPAPDNWVDREKYHTKGNEIKTTNWDKQGGFSELHSTLHSEQVAELVGNESEVKCDVKAEVKCEGGGKLVPTTTSDENFAKIVTTYQEVCGVVNSITADKLRSAYEEYEPQWIIDALAESAVQNKRNWAYAEAILKRWKKEGRNSKRNGKPVITPEAQQDKFRKLYEQQKQVTA